MQKGDRICIHCKEWIQSKNELHRRNEDLWDYESAARLLKMANICNDIKFALRLFVKQSGSSVLGILILGVGFGVSIIFYALVNGVLNSDPPFSNSKNVLSAINGGSKSTSHNTRLKALQAIYKDSTSFKQVAGYQRDKLTILRSNGEGRSLPSSIVTWNFFDVINATPILGRTFTKSDLHPSAGTTAVITHALWQSQFGGDYSAIGSEMIADNQPIKVIGVMPEYFEYPFQQKMWVLSDFGLTYSANKYKAKSAVLTLCMLKDGVSKDQAGAELRRILDKLSEKSPEFANANFKVLLKPYEEIRRYRVEVQPMLYALLFFSLLLLAVACSNISNLVMVRISRRQHELVIRKALGAKTSNIILHVMLEGAMFCAGGLVVGVVVFIAGREYCWSLFNEIYKRPPNWWNIDLDWNVLLFSMALVICCLVVSCLTPAIRALKADSNQILKDESRTATWLFIGKFVKQIVTFQVMGSTTLLIVTLMIILIAHYIMSWQLPYDPERILAVRFHMKQNVGFKTAADIYTYLDNLQNKLEAMPDVQATGFISNGHLVTRQARPIKIENQENDKKRRMVNSSVVYGGLLEMFNIQPLKGRFFTAEDTSKSKKVVIVNQHFVDTYFKNEDPLGKRIRVKGPRLKADEESKRGKQWTGWLTIIGVAPNLQRKLLPGQTSVNHAQLYVSAKQIPSRLLNLLVKTGDKNAVGQIIPIKNTVLEGFPSLEVGGVATVQSAVIAHGRLQYLISTIISIFGSISLIVTLVGLLGLVLFATLQRRREFGIRSAIGAGSKQILFMVYKQAFWQITIGLLLGVAIAISISDYVKANMQASAFPVEIPSFAIGVVISLIACIIAIAIPALRATQVQPNEVLHID